jgi:hypothetical protein
LTGAGPRDAEGARPDLQRLTHSLPGKRSSRSARAASRADAAGSVLAARGFEVGLGEPHERGFEDSPRLERRREGRLEHRGRIRVGGRGQPAGAGAQHAAQLAVILIRGAKVFGSRDQLARFAAASGGREQLAVAPGDLAHEIAVGSDRGRNLEGPAIVGFGPAALADIETNLADELVAKADLALQIAARAAQRPLVKRQGGLEAAHGASTVAETVERGDLLTAQLPRLEDCERSFEMLPRGFDHAQMQLDDGQIDVRERQALVGSVGLDERLDGTLQCRVREAHLASGIEDEAEIRGAVRHVQRIGSELEDLERGTGQGLGFGVASEAHQGHALDAQREAECPCRATRTQETAAQGACSVHGQVVARIVDRVPRIENAEQIACPPWL